MPHFLFYKYSPQSRFENHNDIHSSALDCEIWHPSILSTVPRGLPWWPFAMWWFAHEFHVFANQDYRVCIIRQDDLIIHRTLITPKYLRFPFMANADLQVGDIWTHPQHRGRGLASKALRQILKKYARPNRTLWYVVEENNLPSIRLAETCGFNLIGLGERVPFAGLNFLGSYMITQRY